MNAVSHVKWFHGVVRGALVRRCEMSVSGMAGAGALARVLLFALGGCIAPPTVLPNICGDGIVSESAGEECDDQGVSSICDIDCTLAVCGDGVVNAMAAEECDTVGGSTSCDDDCTVARCGDGLINPAGGESCDDGNVVAGDGCNADCRTNGICGNGTLDTGEACDDGNTMNGDGCSASCQLASCGNGRLEPGESCDHGGLSTATCDSDCTPVTCGDGVINLMAGEQCDAAGMSETCNHDCTVAWCSDGVVNPMAGEQCDNAGESTLCDADCTAAWCGDGIVNAMAGEECDDGNRADGDGCSSACLLDCGNGVLDPGEEVDPPPVRPCACRSTLRRAATISQPSLSSTALTLAATGAVAKAASKKTQTRCASSGWTILPA